MLELETLFMLVNMLCYMSMAPDFQKMAKSYLKIFLRKSLNFRIKIENFLSLKIFLSDLVGYMIHL